MGIAIQGIRITSVNVSKDSNGNEKVEGNYELVSTNDKVLAKQGFNGYNDIKVDMSLETKQALIAFLTGIKKDTMIVLGLTE
jgi:hypothetical protein